MNRFLFQIYYILFTFIAALFKFSIQEILSCGTTNFQVTFEPSRFIFSNTLVATAAIAASATNNGNNNSTDTLSSSGISLLPTTKYLYQPLDSLLSNAQVCNLSQSNNNEIWNSLSLTNSVSKKLFITNNNNNLFKNLPESQMIITKCDECSKCPHELSTIHQFLSRLAVKANLQSLLIIIHEKDGSTSTSSLVNSQFKELERIKLMDNSIAKFVFMNEEPGQLTLCELITDNTENDALKNFSRTSVLFVSISFIILMVISLAWLIFYYVQRFRYAHAKDRLQKRLFNAAKKVLSRIPIRPVKAGDKDLNMDCPVCIDPYKTGDIVRILPCKHTFHKGCVDPWLLEHRTCPMCKCDILKAFGFQITINNSTDLTNNSGRRQTQFSNGDRQINSNINNNGHDSAYSSLGHHRTYYHHRKVAETNNKIQRDSFRSNFDKSNLKNNNNNNDDNENSLNIKTNTFSFPIVSKSHDSFIITPSSSSQLIQVVHTSKAQDFTTSSLTVHNSNVDTHNVAIETTKDNNYNQIYSNCNNKTFYSLNEKNNEFNDCKPINFNLKNNVCKNNFTPHIYRAMTSESKHSNQRQIFDLILVRSKSLSNEQVSFKAEADNQKNLFKLDKTKQQFSTNSEILLHHNIVNDLQSFNNKQINLNSNKNNIWENVASNLILTLPNCVDNSLTIGR